MVCFGKKPDEDETVEDVMDKNRRCTDVLFLLLFVAFMIALFATGIYGFANGDPRILIYGTDYQGDLCGKGDLEGLKVRYWVNPFEVMSTLPAYNPHSFNLRDAKSICLSGCPAMATEANKVSWVCNYPDSDDGYGYSQWTYDTWKLNNYDYYALLNTTLQKTSLQFKGPCYPVLLPTVNNYQSCTYYGTVSSTSEAAFRAEAKSKLGVADSDVMPESYSLSDVYSTLSSTVADFLSLPMAVMERYVDDLMEGWVVTLVMGFFVPVGLSFVWLGVLRYFTGIFAYLVVLMVNVGAILCTVFLYMKAGILGSDAVEAAIGSDAVSAIGSAGYTDPAEENQTVLKYLAYFATVITVCLFLFTLLMLRRLAIAVAVIKVATQAIAGAPSVVFFPIAPVLTALLFGIYWIAAAVFLFASGTIKQQSCDIVDYYPPKKYCIDTASTTNCHCGYKSEMDNSLQNMLIYHFFGLLWTTQFLQAMCYLILASVFATYYFRGGTYGDNTPAGWINTPVIQSMRKMFYYHSGSAALGSLIIAIMQFIRVIVAYVCNKMKSMEKDNPVMRYAACCVQYCLWYVQKVLEWLNRNAYIMIAIKGNSYCWSAWEAVSLIFENILTVGAVNVVGDTLLFLGKLSVSLVAGFLAFLMLDSETYVSGDNKISSPLFIVLFVIIFAYVIVGLFMSVVEMAIDTVLLSFCKDCKMHGGRPKYAPPLLEEVLGKAEEEGKARRQAKADKAAAKAAQLQAANTA